MTTAAEQLATLQAMVGHVEVTGSNLDPYDGPEPDPGWMSDRDGDVAGGKAEDAWERQQEWFL